MHFQLPISDQVLLAGTCRLARQVAEATRSPPDVKFEVFQAMNPHRVDLFRRWLRIGHELERLRDLNADLDPYSIARARVPDVEVFNSKSDEEWEAVFLLAAQEIEQLRERLRRTGRPEEALEMCLEE